MFSADGARLVTTAADQVVRFWDVRSWTLDGAFALSGHIKAIDLSEDSRWVLAIVSEATRDWKTPVTFRAFAIDGETARPRAEFDLFKHLPGLRISVVVSLKGEHFALATEPLGKTIQSELQIWETAGARRIASIASKSPVMSLRFSPDGELLAVADQDGTVVLWTVRSGQPVHRFQHEAWARDVAFHPSGKYLATAGDDKTSRIWDLTTMREIARMKQRGDALGVKFSRDGRLVLNLLDDAAISVWPWRSEDLVAEASRRLVRNLTPEEWELYLPGQPYRKTRTDLED
jgi:WD40 repeat protein